MPRYRVRSSSAAAAARVGVERARYGSSLLTGRLSLVGEQQLPEVVCGESPSVVGPFYRRSRHQHRLRGRVGGGENPPRSRSCNQREHRSPTPIRPAPPHAVYGSGAAIITGPPRAHRPYTAAACRSTVLESQRRRPPPQHFFPFRLSVSRRTAQFRGSSASQVPGTTSGTPTRARGFKADAASEPRVFERENLSCACDKGSKLR